MRIIQGELRGRDVRVPPGEIRPIMDRMRESLFSILDDIEGRSFLDLFTGSAVVALEAYSRGARPVACVEKDRGKRRTIEENLRGLDPPVTLRLEPVERYVVRNSALWDIVYLDPPFPYRYRRDLMKKLARSRGLHDDSLVAIHTPRSDRLPDRIDRLVKSDERNFGGSILSFYTTTPSP